MQTPLASELYALSQSRKCEGHERCHWCSAPCDRRVTHDDDPPIPFSRSKSTALCPTNAFVCVGCQLYRRRRQTVTYLNGLQKDSQSLCNYSWYMTHQHVFVLNVLELERLYPVLLNPPKLFALSLMTVKIDKEGNVTQGENLIQLARVNRVEKVKFDTPLTYTLDNKPYQYTVYELEECLKHGNAGVSGGVRELVELLGPYEGLPRIDPETEVKKKGRPRKSG